MPGVFATTITPSYKELRSIYVGAGAMKSATLSPGKVTVLIEANEEFSVEGTLSSYGLLTGMAKLYRSLDLKDGSKLDSLAKRPV